MKQGRNSMEVVARERRAREGGRLKGKKAERREIKESEKEEDGKKKRKIGERVRDEGDVRRML